MVEPEPKILHELYQEVGRNFRHFLAWRRFLFAGYFAILAVLFSTYDWQGEKNPYLNSILLLVAILLSFLFWILDRRNRQLIRNVSDAGANLEKTLNLGDTGCYKIYKYDEHRLTHSSILGWFYWTAILGYTIWFVATVLQFI